VPAAGAPAGSAAGAVALGESAEPPAPVDRPGWAGPLTERELEVAMLVARGASNRQVAERLFVSVRTIEVHVGRVFTKLGVRSRVELAVLAHRGGSALSAAS
ncbi:response regulator transcription factor, partial [Agromyces seonyuensis]